MILPVQLDRRLSISRKWIGAAIGGSPEPEPGAAPLDGSNITHGWSLDRKLWSSYEGPLLRMRVDMEDQPEYDIYPDGAGRLNTGIIASLAGANQAFVVKAYQQNSLNGGKNLEQASASAQPMIYDGTSVPQLAGRSAARFIPTRWLDGLFNWSGPYTIYINGSVDVPSSWQAWLDMQGTLSNTLYNKDNGYFTMYPSGINGEGQFPVYGGERCFHGYSFSSNPTNDRWRMNASYEAANEGYGNSGTMSRLYLGCQGGSGYPLTGYWNELLIHESAEHDTAAMEDIETRMFN